MLIEPGAAATELPTHITDAQTKEMARQLYAGVPVTAEDIAEIIAFAVNRPHHLTINGSSSGPPAKQASPLTQLRSAQ